MRFIKLVVLLAALGPLLGGCGPKTVLSTLFPLRYPVRTTVVLDDHGQRVEMTGQARCEVVDATDSIARNFEANETGGGLWARLHDGSIFALHQQDCPWRSRSPERGEVTSRSMASADLSGLRFPNGDDASIVEEITVSGSQTQGAALTVVAIDSIAVDGPHPKALAEGFAGLKDLRAWDVVNKGAEGSGAIAPLVPGKYVGTYADVWRLAPGTDCGQTNLQPQFLDERSVCGAINDCDSAAHAPSHSVCGANIGSLIMTPNADYSLMQTTIGDLQPQPTRRYYRTDLILAARHDLGIGSLWSPQLCINNLCASSVGRFRSTLAYFPRTNLLVRMGTEFRIIDISSKEF